MQLIILAIKIRTLKSKQRKWIENYLEDEVRVEPDVMDGREDGFEERRA